ncbi:NAD(P)/FAD-dependent oxidoreductase [Legionella rubrilucens]|nr:FAD-binding oxidoreductase [Legionella rubrilucens]
MKFDCLVLGAGIIGVSVAAHLQKRGRAVALVDVKCPGSETSFGNAGLIQREGVYPYAFPRDWTLLAKYAFNRSPEVHYHWQDLVKLAPFLWKYWFYSKPSRHADIARNYATLIEHSVREHHALADSAGCRDALKSGGWLKLFRTAKRQDNEVRFSEHLRAEFGVQFDALDAAALQRLEPHLNLSLQGALRYGGAETVSDPGALVSGYAAYFKQLGGRFFLGDAFSLSEGWQMQAEAGIIRADSVVICLGPWSQTLCARLGYRFPLAVKRGYHMHYGKEEGAFLHHPVLDVERGYLLAPMTQGIRLTTGAEFARLDAQRTPRQLNAVEPIARQLFPIKDRLEASPWMGSRPCTPDMLPIIGPAPRHAGLWLAFGHGHHGLTLGPVTGRLLAEMLTGEELLLDPAPFSPQRFCNTNDH